MASGFGDPNALQYNNGGTLAGANGVIYPAHGQIQASGALSVANAIGLGQTNGIMAPTYLFGWLSPTSGFSPEFGLSRAGEQLLQIADPGGSVFTGLKIGSVELRGRNGSGPVIQTVLASGLQPIPVQSTIVAGQSKTDYQVTATLSGQSQVLLRLPVQPHTAFDAEIRVVGCGVNGGTPGGYAVGFDAVLLPVAIVSGQFFWQTRTGPDATDATRRVWVNMDKTVSPWELQVVTSGAPFAETRWHATLSMLTVSGAS